MMKQLLDRTGLFGGLLTAFAMEQRVTTLGMLDEVSRDMRLDWPGKRRLHRPVSETFGQAPSPLGD